ncbi:Copper binding protein plastocyanin/azurin family [Paramagnetospirillum magnetotacticum MS-1]|uniref:Copper binding protein plastocyanin/azurin family n=1 Tax=Paramagnetospirillum magnetotacticum MS-1 TaxID=272627 RepID=A0A0C2V4G6_PARME|nr:cupredoxin domain-containing protein [Paramagnetospirillum magnetotacticum]KIL99971.1 Copper binding protein plastocyanin/azurin family [Paramagnetospirillum magnetotacticum MS-1]
MRPIALFLAVLSFAVAALAAADESHRVSMDKNLFTPKLLRVKPGATVEWVNDEKRTSHSVFFESEKLAESQRLFPGESWKRTFDKPGSYPYRCGPHPEMVGIIEVAP